ncbi:Flp family type IVb pilin [Sphingomonas edaphi]|uniref:Flp family type IVb pilin n=1 Tax=Sphingomonas edaphi TaxID=2315689 RepID=A0A418Q1W8_9SPHN|nr:Flp family type IVb pilin [Sphingomonas edaphi]RIX31899.1 Flp family type IVb pilin [Sphingomonas edaphi]
MLAIRIFGRKLRSDKRGATVIEYGLIAALIIIAIMGAMKALGGGANGMWGKLDNKVEEVM